MLFTKETLNEACVDCDFSGRTGTNYQLPTTNYQLPTTNYQPLTLKIRVSVKPVLVEAEELSSAFVANPAVADGRLHVGAELSEQHFRVELDVVQHFAHGVALNQGIEPAAVFVEADVNGVGVAEEVVEVAEDLLV